MVWHADRYFVTTDDGYLVTVRLTPDGAEELGRARLIEPTLDSGLGPSREWDRPVSWTHPAYANQHIVQRNDREMLRASLAAADYPANR